MRVAPLIQLSPNDRMTLEQMARGRRTPVRLVLRAKIILLAAEGLENREIAAKVNASKPTVGLWRARYAKLGLAGIEKDASRPGRPRQDRRDLEQRIVQMTTQEKPRNATHWSTRSLAGVLKIDHVLVHRVWKAHGLLPHRVRSFKLSKDKNFVKKLIDVVGLYLNPPEHALVLCADEKSQIQALDRTQPGLPIKKGRCGTMTHDYKRYGTTTLFAALETLEGKVVGECHQRHRHQEFLKFLRRLNAEFPGDVPLHLIMDNYGTHKHEKVKAWLKRNPRFVPHFVPTSSSWMNLVERWFGHLDHKAIRRGVFRSVADLQASIEAFLTAWNQAPKPFVWTATVESIQEKLTRCRRTLEQIKPGCTSLKSRKKKKK